MENLFNLNAKITVDMKGVLGNLSKLVNRAATLEKNLESLQEPARKAGLAIKTVNPKKGQVDNIVNLSSAIKSLAAAYRELGTAQSGLKPLHLPTAKDVKAAVAAAAGVTAETAKSTQKALKQQAQAKAQAERDIANTRRHRFDTAARRAESNRKINERAERERERREREESRRRFPEKHAQLDRDFAERRRAREERDAEIARANAEKQRDRDRRAAEQDALRSRSHRELTADKRARVNQRIQERAAAAESRKELAAAEAEAEKWVRKVGEDGAKRADIRKATEKSELERLNAEKKIEESRRNRVLNAEKRERANQRINARAARAEANARELAAAEVEAAKWVRRSEAIRAQDDAAERAAKGWNDYEKLNHMKEDAGAEMAAKRFVDRAEKKRLDDAIRQPGYTDFSQVMQGKEPPKPKHPDVLLTPRELAHAKGERYYPSPEERIETQYEKARKRQLRKINQEYRHAEAQRQRRRAMGIGEFADTTKPKSGFARVQATAERLSGDPLTPVEKSILRNRKRVAAEEQRLAKAKRKEATAAEAAAARESERQRQAKIDKKFNKNVAQAYKNLASTVNAEAARRERAFAKFMKKFGPDLRPGASQARAEASIAKMAQEREAKISQARAKEAAEQAKIDKKFNKNVQKAYKRLADAVNAEAARKERAFDKFLKKHGEGLRPGAANRRATKTIEALNAKRDKEQDAALRRQLRSRTRSQYGAPIGPLTAQETGVKRGQQMRRRFAAPINAKLQPFLDPPQAALARLKNYQKYIRGIGQGLGLLSKSTDTATRRVGLLSRATGRAGKAMQSFKWILRSAASVAAGMVFFSMFAGFTQGVRDAVRVSVEFQAALREMNGLAGLTEQKLAEVGERYRTATERLGVGVDPQELVKGVRALYAAGYDDIDTASVIADQGVLLAKAGGMEDTQKAIELLGATMKAYGADASQAEHFTNVLINSTDQGLVTMDQLYQSLGRAAPLAAQAGISIEELLSVIGTITAQGMRTETAVTGIGQVINKLINPSEKGRAVMKKFGLEINATTLSAKGLIATLEEVSRVTKGDPEVLRILTGTARGFNAAAALDQDGNFDIARRNYENVVVGGVKEKRISEMLKTAHAQWEIVVGNVKAAFIWLGKELDGPLAAVLKSFKSIHPDLNELFLTLQVMASEFLKFFSKEGGSALSTAINFVTNGFKDLHYGVVTLTAAMEWASKKITDYFDTERRQQIADLNREKRTIEKQLDPNLEKSIRNYDLAIAAAEGDSDAAFAHRVGGDPNLTPFITAGDVNALKKLREDAVAHLDATQRELKRINDELAKLNYSESLYDTIERAMIDLDKIYAEADAKTKAFGNMSNIEEHQKMVYEQQQKAHHERLRTDEKYRQETLAKEKAERAADEKRAEAQTIALARNFEIYLKQAAKPGSDFATTLAGPGFDRERKAYAKVKGWEQAAADEEARAQAAANAPSVGIDAIKERMAEIKHQVKVDEVTYEEGIKLYKDLLAVAQEHTEEKKLHRSIEEAIHSLQGKAVKLEEKRANIAQTLAEGNQTPAQIKMAKLSLKKNKLIQEGASEEEADMWFHAETAKVKQEEADKKAEIDRKSKVHALKTQAEIAEAEGRTLDAKLLALDAEYLAQQKHEENKLHLTRMYEAKRAKIIKDHQDALEANIVSFRARTVANEVETLREKGQVEQARRLEEQQAADERYQAIKEHVKQMREAGGGDPKVEIEIQRYIESEKTRILREATAERQRIKKGEDKEEDKPYSADPRIGMGGVSEDDVVGFKGPQFRIGGKNSKGAKTGQADPAAKAARMSLFMKLNKMDEGMISKLPKDHPLVKQKEKEEADRKKREEEGPIVTVVLREETPDGKVILKTPSEKGKGERKQEASYQLGRAKGDK